jgi:hypothetical protein
MGKELLIETNIFTPLTRLRHNVVEGQRVGGLAVVEGVLATCEKKNGNGRYYRRELWERELEKYKELVENRRATGELDHPESSIINLKNVSHNIVKFWWDGDHILGQIEILPTPSGNILKALLEAKIQVGVSSRGMGSVKQIGETLEVQDDFELLCWDFVSNPSNSGSWMKQASTGRLNESLNTHRKSEQLDNIIREILCANGNCPLF